MKAGIIIISILILVGIIAMFAGADEGWTKKWNQQYFCGDDAFSTTALTDIVTCPYATPSSIIMLTVREDLPGVDSSAVWVETRAIGSFTVNRGSIDPSGLKYSWVLFPAQ